MTDNRRPHFSIFLIFLMRELALNNCRLDKRYDIQSRLGQGSYAEIFLARDSLASPNSPHSLVAIKALNVFLQNDLDADLERTLVENFQNEAIALDRVRHPNIISRLGHGTARDLRGTVFHYLILEYLPGGDLARLCREKSLEFDTALSYLEQVCAGLAHAHKHDIIHRDIKPQNLLLTADKLTVKIADFGVARVEISDSPITRVGTDIYAPPEHSPAMAGQTGVLTLDKLTPAADIFSLAKSAYVLLTCQSPRFFAGDAITELPFDSRKEVWADELLKVLNKATQRNAANRYQTVDEFWEDLSKIKQLESDGEPITQIRNRVNKSPQPHVAKGYSPIAPHVARFDTTDKLKLKTRKTAAANPLPVIDLDKNHQFPPVKTPPPQPPISETPDKQLEIYQEQVHEPKKRFLRRFATLAIFLIIFAGSLLFTYNYLLGRGLMPNSTKTLRGESGTANSDVNLRSVPSSSGNEPIGVVTKDSKVRVINKQDNWYEIDIIEQGRPDSNDGNATHGWVHGRYIDIEGNQF